MARRRKKPSAREIKKMKVLDTYTPFLKAAVKNAPAEVHDNMEIVATAATALAQQNIPVEEGTARRTVHMEDKSTKTKVLFDVGTAVTAKGGYPYPEALEFGTRRGINVGTPEDPLKTWPAKAARGGGWEMMPWLRPAFRKVRGLMKRVLRAAYGATFGMKLGGRRA